MSQPPWNPGSPSSPDPYDGSSWQPPPASPPGYGPPPGYGGTPPGYGGTPPGYGAPWAGYFDPDDPLVTPPGIGLNGWFARIVATYRRSLRSAALIIGVTQTLPAIAYSVLSLNYVGAFGPTPGDTEPLTTAEAQAQLGSAFAFLGISLVAVVVLSFVQAVGWAAGTWTVTREAAGLPAPPGDAFAYGLRRAPGLWGWSLLAGLIIGLGICACILPGIYLAFALALLGPVYLFERDNPIGRSFRLFHANFGPVLGRLAILAAVLIAGQILAGIVQNLGFAVTGAAEGGITPPGVVFAAVGTALTLPFAIAQLIGIVATYAEQRARELPVTTPQLAAALD